jgi:hypothetical protein
MFSFKNSFAIIQTENSKRMSFLLINILNIWIISNILWSIWKIISWNLINIYIVIIVTYSWE